MQVGTLKGMIRPKNYALQRRLCFVLIRDLTEKRAVFKEIGKVFNNRNHSTIHSGCEAMLIRIEIEPATAELFQMLRAECCAQLDAPPKESSLESPGGSQKAGVTELQKAWIIFRAVAPALGVSVREVQSTSRAKVVMWSRHLVVFFVQENTKLSLLATAKLVGRTDHSTAWNSYQQAKALSETDERFAEMYDIAKKACESAIAAIPPYGQPSAELRLQAVSQAIYDEFGVTVEHMKSNTTAPLVEFGRLVFYSFAVDYAGLSTVSVMRFLGKSRSAVNAGVRKARALKSIISGLALKYAEKLSELQAATSD